ncbi:MAG: hypothetical protein HHJ10_08990 [Cellulomonas sp.]|nr:hypothetical protein [Cellulomonas sp.]
MRPAPVLALAFQFGLGVGAGLAAPLAGRSELVDERVVDGGVSASL